MSYTFGDVQVPAFAANTPFVTNSTFVVEALLLQRVSGFKDQVLRPYVTNSNLNNNELNSIATRIAERAQAGTIDGASVAGVGNSILTRSSTPEGMAPIINGWGIQRAHFTMRVRLVTSIGTTNTLYVTGYTENDNFTQTSIDHNMQFFVNNVVKARNQVTLTPFGQQNIVNQVGTQQVFTDPSSSMGIGGKNTLLMSPMEIYQVMGSAPIYGGEVFAGASGSADVYDTRLSITQRGKTAPKRINTPANYLAGLVNSYVNNPNEGYDDSQINSAMKSYVSQNTFETEMLHRTDFFAIIDAKRQSYGVDRNSFTLKDLMNVDPNVLNVITQIAPDNEQMAYANASDHLLGSDLNTVSASILSSAVPALMTEQMISFIHFKSTNATINGAPETVILMANGFANVDMRLNYDRFKAAFEMIVLNDITYGNNIGYMLDMSVQIDGQTVIKIKVDNCPEVMFVYPTFCDSLFAPVVTTSRDNILNVASDMSNLLDYVKDARYNSSPTPSLSSGLSF